MLHVHGFYRRALSQVSFVQPQQQGGQLVEAQAELKREVLVNPRKTKIRTTSLSLSPPRPHLRSAAAFVVAGWLFVHHTGSRHHVPA